MFTSRWYLAVQAGSDLLLKPEVERQNDMDRRRVLGSILKPLETQAPEWQFIMWTESGYQSSYQSDSIFFFIFFFMQFLVSYNF